MELLHERQLKNPDDWGESLEKVQESLVKYTMQLECVNIELENTTSSQPQPIDEITLESIAFPTVPERERTLESKLAELTLYEVRIESDRCGTEAIKIFQGNPLLPGIIITAQDRFTGMISRRRFFEYMSRPYSWELFSKRPLSILYGLAKTEILVLKSDTSVVTAAQQALQRSPELLYEPIVVRSPEGDRLLDVHQLLLAQSRIHDAAMAALQEAEAKYRSIFENAVDGIFQTTDDGRYLSANPALARIYGYESEAQLIQAFTDIGRQLYVNPKRRAEFVAAMQEHDAVSRFESEVYRQDGSTIWISENARAVRDARGNLLYYEGTVEDITERKLAEEALRLSEARLKQQATELKQALQELQQTQSQLIQTEKLSSLGQMVAGVAHEINNPVNCIYNNLPHSRQYTADLLRLVKLYGKHYPQPHKEIEIEAEAIDLEFLMEDLPKILFTMQQGAERIREIVRSLRTFSRQERGQMQPANLHEGIDSTLLILHHRLKAKGEQPEIKIIKKYGKIPDVECYVGQLNQVFMNLLNNAIDALEEGWTKCKGNGKENKFPMPTIEIRTEVVNDNWVRISITDNGQGMTEEVKKRLFDPFFTTKSAERGTGLGLSIGYQIVVEKHGGKLECFSAPGQGSQFAISIPIHHPN